MGRQEAPVKFKTTLIVFAVFVLLLAFILLFESGEKQGLDAEGKLVFFPSENISRIDFLSEGETISLMKNEESDWSIIQPLETAADQYEAGRMADDFSDLSFNHVVEEEPDPSDLEKYGIPQKTVTLHFKDGSDPVKVLIGMENPLDKTYFAKREDEARVVLIPSTLKNQLEKKLFDFRKKDLFQFETASVGRIAIQTADRKIEAEKQETGWFLTQPVKSLAQQSLLTGILSNLNGLKAKEFLAEEKGEEDLKKWGLDRPGYAVTLDMPTEGTTLNILLNKQDETVYATSSLSSKIVTVDDTLLADLDKEITEFRGKDVAEFYSWEAGKLRIKKSGLDTTLAKSEENDWLFDQTAGSESPETADRSKVDAFIREVEGLEAAGWIDPPFDLASYGLQDPQVEITIWVKEGDEDRPITIFVGSKDEESGQVFVKNDALDYLFKVDAAFLEKIPASASDWKTEAPTGQKAMDPEEKEEIKQDA